MKKYKTIDISGVSENKIPPLEEIINKAKECYVDDTPYERKTYKKYNTKDISILGSLLSKDDIIKLSQGVDVEKVNINNGLPVIVIKEISDTLEGRNLPQEPITKREETKKQKKIKKEENIRKCINKLF